MLHHIAPKDKSRIPTNEDLKVSPEFLEKTIIAYRRQGVEFLSLDDVYHILKSGEVHKCPFVAFTIDDGYLDNYTNAYPIFKKYSVPFTIFIATNFIDQKAILWWDSLEELILSNKSITITDGESYLCETFQQRWDTFRFLREKILSLDQRNLFNELNKMFSNYDIDWMLPIKQKAMSWEHVKVLSEDEICTIGGHTVTHPALNSLNKEEAIREIINGNKILEQHIKKAIYFFAYPYGSPNEVGEREYKIIEQMPLKLAFCSSGGCITNEDGQKMTSLPRMYFYEKIYL